MDNKKQNKKNKEFIQNIQYKSKKDPRFDWKTIFLRDSGGLSSKRILGIIGFLTCVIVFIIAFFTDFVIPEFGELLLTVSASLVGLDSITGIWNKSVKKSN